MPKSVSLATTPSPIASGISTLPGLTSRWTTPRACAWQSASQIAIADLGDVAVAQRAVAQQLSERLPADELRDEIDGLIVAARFEQGDDRGMRQPRRCQRLALGSLRRRRLFADRDPLDGDVAIEAQVTSQPDGAEATLAKPLGQLVAIEDNGSRGSRATRRGFHVFTRSTP